MKNCFRLLIVSLISFIVFRVSPIHAQTSLSISGVTDNRSTYPNAQIPKYNKLELTFQISGSVATNFQFPFDPLPPAGIDPSNYPRFNGISVDGQFLPPGLTDWNQAYQVPGFYFKNYQNEGSKLSWMDDGQKLLYFDWLYPTGQHSWKIRFSPNLVGTWQYRLKVTDASGTFLTSPQSFGVIPSPSHGFIKVSAQDPRYFEYDDGTPFIPQGFQGSLSEPDLLKYSQNGINLIRNWASGFYGTSWLQWIGSRNIYDGYLPRAGIESFHDPNTNKDQITLVIQSYDPANWYDPCRWQFSNVPPESLKPNTNYHISLKYWAAGITGPKYPNISQNYGVVVKMSRWMWDSNDETQSCNYPGKGLVLTTFGHNTSDWQSVEGTWNSGTNSFLQPLHLVMDNTTAGKAWIDSISVREDLGNGQYGPEILKEPSMQYDTYFKEFQAQEWDKQVENAEKYGVYIKLVLEDKNDMIFYKLNDDGSYAFAADNQDGFYGNWRTVNKTRWLQQAVWRYFQARWGYSPAVHSWELTNEGDPWNGNHYALTDELGKYMHQFTPNAHLVTTSFWHSFPAAGFWANPEYPNVDYADVHAYLSTGWLNKPVYETDSATFHLDYSADTRTTLNWYAAQRNIPTKPIMRGETSMDLLNAQSPTNLTRDTYGVWLHTFLWSSLDSGAMTEVYWELNSELSGLWPVYQHFADFLANIPINNGHYQNAQAATSSALLQWVGQKDTTNNRAHLWVRNTNFTWGNVINNTNNFTGLPGTITLTGFSPHLTLPVEWHQFTAQGLPQITRSTETTSLAGSLILNLPTDSSLTDVGVKIGNYSVVPTPPTDYQTFLSFLPSFNLTATIFDFNSLIKLLFK